MALFSVCFVVLFAAPCTLYFSTYLAKTFTKNLTKYKN